MRILYDNQVFKVQKFGGVSRYHAELINGLKQYVDYEALPKKFYSHNKHLNLLGFTHYDFIRGALNIPGIKRIERHIRRNEEFFFLKHLQQGNFDVYHPTYYNPPYLNYMKKDKILVVTIHDLTFELYYDKEYDKIHQESINKKNLIQHASHIIVPSENTKKDILTVYPHLSSENISVIYHGSSLPENIVESKINLPSNYLLYVGKRGKYKNFAWLLESVADFLRTTNIHLVCAGGRPFTNEEIIMIENLNVKDKVAYYDINNDQELAALYKRAACFIYPSSHEGFGIPILEAYSCGCPALLAESSCFPEIGANGALYFENGNKDQLIAQLTKILNDQELVVNLREKGYQRLKDFSWQRTVKEHVEVYKRVVEG